MIRRNNVICSCVKIGLRWYTNLTNYSLAMSESLWKFIVFKAESKSFVSVMAMLLGTYGPEAEK